MTDITIDGTKDIVFINALANQLEQSAGPLVAMGNIGNTKTTMSFDDPAPNPTNPVVIAPTSAGVPSTPAGLKAFLHGTILISGVATPSTAYRA